MMTESQRGNDLCLSSKQESFDVWPSIVLYFGKDYESILTHLRGNRSRRLFESRHVRLRLRQGDLGAMLSFHLLLLQRHLGVECHHRLIKGLLVNL